MAQAILSIDGKKYMSTKAAADLWDLKPRTVAEYCKDGKISQKFKNGNLGWYISVDEIKPLSIEDIRRLLVLTLQLKNNPRLEIDWSTFRFDDMAIDAVYKKLAEQGYIEKFEIKKKKRIPYEVILTQQGMELVTNFKKKAIPDYQTTLQQWLPILISVAELYIQARQSLPTGV